MKKIIIAIVAIFISWSVLDYLIHGVWLMPTYEETASLWRAPEEMKAGLMNVVSIVSAICFVLIYALFFKERSLTTGFLYGLIFGIAWGTSMGFGSYCYMPIPLFLAQAWFAAVLIKQLVAGCILGLVVKG